MSASGFTGSPCRGCGSPTYQPFAGPAVCDGDGCEFRDPKLGPTRATKISAPAPTPFQVAAGHRPGCSCFNCAKFGSHPVVVGDPNTGTLRSSQPTLINIDEATDWDLDYEPLTDQTYAAMKAAIDDAIAQLWRRTWQAAGINGGAL